MPPQLSAAVLRTVVKDTPILLPFLYPAASYRLLHSSVTLHKSDKPVDRPFDKPMVDTKFMDMIRQLPNRKPSLPPLPSSEDAMSISARGIGHTQFAGSVQRERKAFKDLDGLSEGVRKAMTKLSEERELRDELRDARGERINPELYKYSAPLADRTYISPKDLRYEEYEKFLRNRRFHVKEDFFERVQENPLDHYKNFNLLKDFMTSAGRIKHRSLTGLSNTNQRKLSKAIRRAIGIGLMPSVYRHPEILRSEQQAADGLKGTADNERGR